MNVLTTGPIQFIGNPPYAPNKIIEAGQLAMMLAVVWVNPSTIDPSGAPILPGTTVLDGRTIRVRFETINLTNVTNGPDHTDVRLLNNVLHFFPWFFVPSDPGVNPNLFETNVTVDVTNVRQPFAAFSTWHFDVDSEPGFLGRPTIPAGWQHDVPARYLVYKRV